MSEKTYSRIPRAVLTLIEHLVAGLVACRIHEPTHQRVVAALSQVRDALHELRTETSEQAFALLVQGESLSFQGKIAVPANISAARLLEALRRWKAAGIQIHADVPDSELATLCRILLRSPDNVVADAAAVNRALAELGVLAVRLVPGATAEPARAPAPTQAAPTANSRSLIATVRDGVEEMFSAIAAGQPADVPRARRCAESLLTAVDAATTGVETLDLSQQPAEDPLLVLHAMRCSGLAMIAMRGTTRDQDLVLRVGTAALLHDVGKLRLPLDLIAAEGEHADESNPAVRQHPTIGAELLLQHGSVDPLCLAIVFGHHRSPVASGYPDTPHEHRPSRATQLVRICDLFESLTARRGDRPPMSPSRAWRVLCADDSLLDKSMLRRVVEGVGFWPIGATLALSSGESARVVRPTRDPSAPLVRVLTAGTAGTPPGGLLDLSRTRSTTVLVAAPAAI
ncbi:MAG: HD domain-containing protein [Planctomycetes bacterium]|nr:HD domain-containing protein [Planctomycetota bacterium]